MSGCLMLRELMSIGVYNEGLNVLVIEMLLHLKIINYKSQFTPFVSCFFSICFLSSISYYYSDWQQLLIKYKLITLMTRLSKVKMTPGADLMKTLFSEKST